MDLDATHTDEFDISDGHGPTMDAIEYEELDDAETALEVELLLARVQGAGFLDA